jgi:hypothetical protein
MGIGPTEVPPALYPGGNRVKDRHTTTVVDSLLAAALLAAAVLAGCEDSTGPEQPQIPVPTVSGVDTTVVSPGDTITVNGSDFDDDTELNRVVFNNSLARAVPFEGTTTVLRAVVPENAMSGELTVTRAGQLEPGVGPKITVMRAVGDVWVVGGARDVDIDTPGAAEYLVIPYATGGPATKNHQYALSGTELPPTLVTRDVRLEVAGGTVGMTMGEGFEVLLRRVGREVRERVGPPRRQEGPSASSPTVLQQFRQFNVWNRLEGGDGADPANYTRVTAELRYPGEHVLVYADVDTLATGNLTHADFQNFGRIFDDDIKSSAAKYFGTESDVDDNDRVIMLITPVVNSLTPRDTTFVIGGFFFDTDLNSTSQMPPGTTNQAEIFYVLAADPVGRWSDPRSRAAVAEKNIKTIVHEYEHLISFSHRLFKERPGSEQIAWLEEGMAHMAEDLLALETGEAKYNTDNEIRGQRYRQNPGIISLEDEDSPLTQRGGIYLFLRLLGDRFGNHIYKQILQNDCIGRECIEMITGEDFYATVGEFLAAMYLSGSGVAADDRYQYDSIDLVDFGALGVTGATFNGTDVGNQLRRTSGDFFVFGGSSTPTSRVSVSTSSSDMGLRTIFVRIQ